MSRLPLFGRANLSSDAFLTTPEQALGNGVAQVAHLKADSKDVSGCSTAPYEFSSLVRNEEVAGSTPVSSTRISIT